MPKAKRKNQAPPPIEIPEGVIQLYSNSLNVLTTTWDFILLFGSAQLPEKIGGPGQTLKAPIRVDAAITMSPQHAKASAKALQSVVEGYEKRFGTIKLPEED